MSGMMGEPLLKPTVIYSDLRSGENETPCKGRENVKDKEENPAGNEGLNPGTLPFNKKKDGGASIKTDPGGADSSTFASSSNKSCSRQKSLASDENEEGAKSLSPVCKRRTSHDNAIESDKKTSGGVEAGASSSSSSSVSSSMSPLNVSTSANSSCTSDSSNANGLPDNGHGGARPKTTQQVNAPSTSSQRSSKDIAELEKYKRQLLAVMIPVLFYQSTAVQALHFMLDPKNKDDPTLIEMAVKCLKVKLNRFPTSSELIELLDQCSMEKEAIVRTFMNIFRSKEKSATEAKHSHTNILEHTSEQNSQITANQQLSMQMSPETKKNMESASLPPINFDAPGSNEEKNESSVLQSLTTNYDNLSEFPPEEPRLSHQAASLLVEQGQTLASLSFQQKPSIESQSRNTALRALETENIFLKERLTCMVCKERPIEITVLPCSHFNLCETCADKYFHCPLCNEKILAEVKTYMC